MFSFAKLLAVVMSAVTLINANSITFINQDSTKRTIYVVPTEGCAEVQPVTIEGNCQQKVEFPQGWIGNAYSVSEGKENKPGMLAEATFQGSGGATFFDVSAIVDPNDTDGVKEMFPASQLTQTVKSVISGCNLFPCNTAYYHPDDIQTASCTEVDLIVTLGTKSLLPREEEDAPRYVERRFVLGQH